MEVPNSVFSASVFAAYIGIEDKQAKYSIKTHICIKGVCSGISSIPLTLPSDPEESSQYFQVLWDVKEKKLVSFIGLAGWLKPKVIVDIV